MSGERRASLHYKLRKRTKFERLLRLPGVIAGHYRINRKHMNRWPALRIAITLGVLILKD